MKSAQILRAAAIVLSMAGMSAAASAQSMSDPHGKPAIIAMTSVRESEAGSVDTRAARAERIAESVASVKGFEADAEVREAIERRVGQDAPEAKVLRAVMMTDEWSVKMTELGLPKSEYRRGVVVYQLPDQDVIVHQQIVVERPFFQVSETEAKYSVRLGTPRVKG